MFELFGSLPTEETSTPTDRKMHNLQGLVGWRWNYTKRLDFHFGAGTEIYHGLSTPDILAYLGVNWRLGPIWSLAKDSDKDGVLDEDDLCPGTRKSERNLVNGDGCADSDGDGVYNNLDECPDTPRGTKVNDLGCAVERVKNITLKNINFYTGTAKMVKASRKSFNKAVRDLLEIKSTIKKVIVEGHTDSVGKRAMNQKLSQFRANTIRKLLVDEVGFSDSQVRAVGHGEDRPVATNKTKKGRLKNRRVELRLIRHK